MTILAAQRVYHTPSSVTISPGILARNNDGQFSVIRSDEAHIFTPSTSEQQTKLGSSLNTHAEKQVREVLASEANDAAENGANGRNYEVSLNKTFVSIDRKDKIDWSAISGEWDIHSPTEVSWVTGCWSPTGLTRMGGCFYVVLNDNGEARMLGPSKNSVTDTWSEVFDLTSCLVSNLLPECETKIEYPEYSCLSSMYEGSLAVKECFTTTLQWSPATSLSALDHSILALGHSSGHVSLWCLKSNKGGLYPFARLLDMPLGTKVTSVSWSPWQSQKEDSISSLLSVAYQNGKVISYKVEQQILIPNSFNPFIPRKASISLLQTSETNGDPITNLKTVNFDTGKVIVAFTQTGRAGFIIFQPATAGEMENDKYYQPITTEIFHFPDSQIKGSSKYSPCVDILRIPKTELIAFALSTCAVHAFSISPVVSYAEERSLELSSLLYQAYVESTERKFDEVYGSTRTEILKQDQSPQISGFQILPSTNLYAMTFAHKYPHSFIYQAGRATRTHFIFGSIEDLNEKSLDGEMVRLLQEAQSVLSISSSLQIMGLLYLINRHASSSEFMDQLYEKTYNISKSQLTNMTGTFDALTNFHHDMYYNMELQKVRLAENITRIVSKNTKIPKFTRERFGSLNKEICSIITQRVCSSTASVYSTFKNDLSDADEAVFAGLRQFPANGNEHCPICDGRLEDSSSSTLCSSGHSWERCSITHMLITTVDTWTCMSCDRKTLTGHGLNDSYAITKQILHFSTSCLICGGRWKHIR